MDLAQRSRAYLACIEQARAFEELGKTRRFDDVRLAFEAGRKAVRSQRYGVRTVVTEGSTVALEADWEGTLAVPFGSLQAGEVMRCTSAMFLRFDAEGRIHRQDNYDCFPPF
jgi:hypothetical protein